jgi:uncharacterized protein
MRTIEPIHIAFPNREHLRGDLHFSNQPGDRAIVFVHGFGSVRTGEKSAAVASACERADLTFCCFDFRGHGESGGSMRDLRPTRLIEDLAAVRDYLVGRGIKRLGLVGSSMGGFASAWFAAQCDEVRACVMIAPAFRFLERRWNALSEFERRYWKDAGWVRYKNEWIDVEVGYGLVDERELYPWEQLAARWTKPALIFHGAADDTVPYGDSLEFLDKAGDGKIELRLFKNGDHRLIDYKDEMAAEACRFLIHAI